MAIMQMDSHLHTDHFPPLPATTLYSQDNEKINWPQQFFYWEIENICCLHFLYVLLLLWLLREIILR